MDQLIEVALGKAPADILLKNAFVLNVFNGEVVQANVALVGDKIAGVGDYQEGREVVDLTGSFLIPGLIDAHIHIESSMLTPPGFARAVVPHGTTTVIADPHELVNATGLSGLEYMIKASKQLPLDIYYQIPSCVPATTLETAGARVDAEAVAQAFKDYPDSRGLGEMMNYPGVYMQDADLLAKIKTTRACGKIVDGHSPLLTDKLLQAYVAAGVQTDHECTSASEAEEKLSLGVHILIREGSAAKNLDQLLDMVTSTTYPYCSFCCDDRHPADLLAEGEIDHILRHAVAWGLDPVTAVRMATINPARLYGLTDRGAIAPGYLGDIAVVDSIYTFRVKQVYKRGVKVAENGNLIVPMPAVTDPDLLKSVLQTINLPQDLRQKLNYKPPVGVKRARVIEVISDQLVTRQSWLPIGAIEPEYDVMKVAVIERYNRGGSVGLGFIRGFGLKAGALASTVAHDSHNLIVIGADEEAMFLAAKTVAEMGGGLAVISGNNKVLATLPLPVAGLMSDESAERMALKQAEVNSAAQALGCSIYSPFMTMSFMTLPVIPALKITDQGLVDVNQFKLVDLWD
jgi:adenine deaminase